jgi:hypothetical protein
MALISEQQIQLRDAVTGLRIRYLPLLHCYFSVKFAPDSECVLLVGGYKCLVWNTITGHYHVHLNEHEEEGDEEGSEDNNSGTDWDDERDIWVVEWSHDGKIFRGDRLIDAELADLTGQPICSGTTFKVAFSRNAKFIVTVYADDFYKAITKRDGNQCMQIWNSSTCAPIGEPHECHAADSTELIISWDSNRLIGALDLRSIDIFDTTTGAWLATYGYVDLIPQITPYSNVCSGAGVLYIADDGWVRDTFSNSILCWIPQRYRNVKNPRERWRSGVRVQYNGSVLIFQDPEWTPSGEANHTLTSNLSAIENTHSRKRSISQVE